MSNQPQTQGQLLPFEKIIKPAQVQSLGCLTPDQKTQYFAGITNLWKKIQENPAPDNPERMAAHKRLSEFTNHLKGLMIKWKTDQAQAAQQSGIGAATAARQIQGQGQVQIQGQGQVQGQIQGQGPPQGLVADQGQVQDAGNPPNGQMEPRQGIPQQVSNDFSQRVKEQARQLQVLVPPQYGALAQEEIQRYVNNEKRKYAILLSRIETLHKQYMDFQGQVNHRQKQTNRPLTNEEKENISTRISHHQQVITEARAQAASFKRSREEPQAGQQGQQQALQQGQQQGQQQVQQQQNQQLLQQNQQQANLQAHQQVQQQAKQQAQQQAQQHVQAQLAQQQALKNQQLQAQQQAQNQAQQHAQQQQQIQQQAQKQQQQRQQQQQAHFANTQQGIKQENQQQNAQGTEAGIPEAGANVSAQSNQMEVDHKPSISAERPNTASLTGGQQNQQAGIQVQPSQGQQTQAAPQQQKSVGIKTSPATQPASQGAQGTPTATTSQGPFPLSHQMAKDLAAQKYSQTQLQTPHGHPAQPPQSQPIQRESSTNASTTSSNSRPPTRPLSVVAPVAVPLPAARPTLSGGPHTMGQMGQPAIQKPPMYTLEGDGERVLSKKKLEDLVRQVTGGTAGESTESLDPDVEETLLDVADEFVDNVITAACRVAKLRGSSTLELRDIQLILERNYNIRVPGYASDELRTVKKIQPSQAWTQKMSAVQAAKVTGGKADL